MAFRIAQVKPRLRVTRILADQRFEPGLSLIVLLFLQEILSLLQRVRGSLGRGGRRGGPGGLLGKHRPRPRPPRKRHEPYRAIFSPSFLRFPLFFKCAPSPFPRTIFFFFP